MARQKKIDLEHMTEKEKMKYEIAGELGLLAVSYTHLTLPTTSRV